MLAASRRAASVKRGAFEVSDMQQTGFALAALWSGIAVLMVALGRASALRERAWQRAVSAAGATSESEDRQRG